MNTTVLRKYVDVGDALLGQPKNQFLSSDVRSFRNAPTRRSFFLEKAIVSMPKFQVYAGCCMIMQLASYRNGGAQGRRPCKSPR